MLGNTKSVEVLRRSGFLILDSVLWIIVKHSIVLELVARIIESFGNYFFNR